MAQLEVLAHSRTAQVEITILHTDIIATIGIVLNSEWRCETLAENVQLRNQDLNITCRHLGVFRLTLAHDTNNLNTEFTSQLVSTLTEGCVLRLIENQLCNTITIAQVNKSHTSHLPCALNPSGEFHLVAGIGET